MSWIDVSTLHLPTLLPYKTCSTCLHGAIGTYKAYQYATEACNKKNEREKWFALQLWHGFSLSRVTYRPLRYGTRFVLHFLLRDHLFRSTRVRGSQQTLRHLLAHVTQRPHSWFVQFARATNFHILIRYQWGSQRPCTSKLASAIVCRRSIELHTVWSSSRRRRSRLHLTMVLLQPILFVCTAFFFWAEQYILVFFAVIVKPMTLFRECEINVGLLPRVGIFIMQARKYGKIHSIPTNCKSHLP